jgi:Ino eighty subunit 2
MPPAGRKLKQKTKDEEREDVAEEGEEEEVVEVVTEEARPPAMYRWISSTQGSGESAQMLLSFSVPPTALLAPPHEPEGRQPKAPNNCAVEGCGQPRKYRLVKDWTIGACGMAHLKSLEGH